MSDETASTPTPTLPTPPEEPAAAPREAVPPVPPLQVTEIENGIVEVLKTVFDPEIPVNIYELGLVYDVDVQENGEVTIRMTLTSPACPVAGSLPPEVQTKVERVPGVTKAEIDLVWDPAWNPGMMSEAAKLQLGMF